jgi:hypothetical protein
LPAPEGPETTMGRFWRSGGRELVSRLGSEDVFGVYIPVEAMVAS